MLQSVGSCRTVIRWGLTAGLVITLAGLRPAAAADGSPPQGGQMLDPITDVFYLRAIYYQAAVRTLLRIDPTNTPFGGTQLSAENDLGLPRNNPLGSLELMVRMRERNRLRVDYIQLDRSAAQPIARTIVFGNQVFNTGSTVQSTLNVRMMTFTYTRAFVQTDRFELGGGLGVHLIDADAIGAVPATFQRHETSEAGAAPTIALDAIWRISSRFAFTGRGQYFGTVINGLEGSIGDYHGDVQYRWQPNFALGFGYSYIRLNFESSNAGGTPGLLRLAVQGPEAFVRVSF